MSLKYTEAEVPLNELVLDDNNPRFAQLYTGNSQEDIIKYLLEEEDAKALAKNIVNRGFFRPDKKLWVLKKNGKYLVKDGNRRCAAVKALQDTAKYSLSLSPVKFKTLPVLVYEDEKILDDLIKEEHTTSSIKEWSTIAKALEIYRLSKNNADETELKSIDSNPANLMRIAHFYNEAVKIEQDKFKELLRNTGKKGRKLTIFERLFQSSELCGYKFGGKKANYALVIQDNDKFEKYIKAIVDYLQKNPNTTFHKVDKVPDQLNFLKEIGIATENVKQAKQEKPITPQVAREYATTSTGQPVNVDIPSSATAKPPLPQPLSKIETKNRTSNLFPRLLVVRSIPTGLRDILSEGQRICFDHDKGYPNAAMALLRMAFECTLDLILGETTFNGKVLNKIKEKELSVDNKLSRKKNKFTNLISSKSFREKMSKLDLEVANTFMHSTWTSTNKEIIQYAARTEELINWMLQKQSDFEADLDLSKL